MRTFWGGVLWSVSYHCWLCSPHCSWWGGILGSLGREAAGQTAKWPAAEWTLTILARGNRSPWWIRAPKSAKDMRGIVTSVSIVNIIQQLFQMKANKLELSILFRLNSLKTINHKIPSANSVASPKVDHICWSDIVVTPANKCLHFFFNQGSK